jgi:hypothetical protein
MVGYRWTSYALRAPFLPMLAVINVLQRIWGIVTEEVLVHRFQSERTTLEAVRGAGVSHAAAAIGCGIGCYRHFSRYLIPVHSVFHKYHEQPLDPRVRREHPLNLLSS